MQLNLLVLSYVVSAAVCAAVTVVAWRRRTMTGARGLALLTLAVGWWLVANTFEAAALDRSTKIAWSVVAYVGIESAPVLYLLFVLGWTRQDAWLTPRRIALLLVLPCVSVAMAATNEWHRLLWPSVTLVDAWGVAAVYEHGPWFWVEMAYSYALIGAGLVALVAAVHRYPGVYSTRMRLVILASLAPIVASVAYAAGLDAWLHADLSSIAFAVAGLFMAWGILRFQLLELVPVAWAALVDTLGDAVLVLDPGQRLIALNPSAVRLLGIRDEAVGRPIVEVLGAYPELIAICEEAGHREAEIPVRSGGSDQPFVDSDWPSSDSGSPSPDAGSAATAPDARWFNARITPIEDARGRDVGQLVVLRDVTERRQMVEAIRRLSLTDDLTGLLNRRGFMTLAEQQIRTALRTRNRLWLLIADVDDLKDINDRLGHQAGDRALCDTARLLRRASFREADVVARLGGDEFVVLATEITPTPGEALLERLENAVERANQVPGCGYELSVSAGVALFDPDRPQTLDELIGDADRRMYERKQSRREALASPEQRRQRS